MDDTKRHTLELMTDVSLRLSIREAGKHLILIAYDYSIDNELSKARNVLSMVSDYYYDNHLIEDVLNDEFFSKAVIELILEFGVTDFKLLRDLGFRA